MPKSLREKPLGEVLQQAGLVSPGQIQVALQDQIYNQDLRIGEIFALRGWIKQETADFFAEKLASFSKQQGKQPIGYYFKEAALLDDRQISQILAAQKQQTIWTRFGKLAVQQGLLKEETVEFFLENLSSKATLETVFMGRKVLEYK